MALTIPEQQLNKFFEVLASSKLPSELAELVDSPVATYYLAIQAGTADAQKIKIPLLRGMLGSYNATTNTPSLSNGTGIPGEKYVVSAPGTINFGAGAIDLEIDDIIEFADGAWRAYELKTKKGAAGGYVPLGQDSKIANQYLPDSFGNDKNFVHNQGTPASVWNITHNLQKFPSVTVLDSAGNGVIGDEYHIDENSLTITFNAAFSGSATLN